MSDLIKQRWYLLGQPWCHSEDAGLNILAGSEDPHTATHLGSFEDWGGEQYDVDTARALAQHVVDIHNDWLDSESPSPRTE